MQEEQSGGGGSAHISGCRDRRQFTSADTSPVQGRRRLPAAGHLSEGTVGPEAQHSSIALLRRHTSHTLHPVESLHRTKEQHPMITHGNPCKLHPYWAVIKGFWSSHHMSVGFCQGGRPVTRGCCSMFSYSCHTSWVLALLQHIVFTHPLGD